MESIQEEFISGWCDTGVSKCLKKVLLSGKTFGQKSKCLGFNRDFQANPGGILSGEGVFCLERRGFVCLCSSVLKERGPPKKI